MSNQDTQDAAPDGFTQVEISRQPVELYKVLKFEGLVGSGGEAKSAVASGLVLVNGSVETQKRKQIVAGDKIEFGTDKLFIVFAAPLQPAPVKPSTIKPSAPAAKKPSIQRAAIPLAKRGKK